MPGEEETEVMVEKPKRAPRKRAAKAVSENIPAPEQVTAVKRVSRKRSVPEEKIALRKAPTPITATKQTSKSKKRQSLIIAVMLIVGIGSSAAVGLTDKGKIDINQMIEARNEKVKSGQSQESLIPVQNTSKEPDGGLIPVTNSNSQQQRPVVEEATTTDQSASSTPEGNVPTPPNEEPPQPVPEATPAEAQ